jgi:predicted enzyme related to lactoylglutathione lyase
MPANPVIHFEIPVHDMRRAIGFYERVFDLALESADVDGNEMAFFPFSEGAAGASGALAKGESYVPGKAGPRICFSVEDVAAALQRALAAGGCQHYPVTDVPGYGRVAEFLDLEGNVIALHSALPEPSTGSTPAPGLD